MPLISRGAHTHCLSRRLLLFPPEILVVARPLACHQSALLLSTALIIPCSHWSRMGGEGMVARVTCTARVPRLNPASVCVPIYKLCGSTPPACFPLDCQQSVVQDGRGGVGG